MATAAKKLHFSPGQHVNSAAKMLVDAVNAGAETAEGEFNEITLRAVKGTTVSEIEQQYNTASEARAKAYRESPKGIAAKLRAEERLRSAQATADALMMELNTLDFKSDVAVLDWFARFQDPSDFIGVEVNKFKVIQAFERAGYQANVNLGDDFKENDRDNYARYLVGQALSMLQSHGAIHGMYGSFHERWKAKFIQAAKES